MPVSYNKLILFSISPSLFPKPKAIIAVDLFGQLADYDAIEKIAKKYNLFLIEDACQSFGASYKKRMSCLSC